MWLRYVDCNVRGWIWLCDFLEWNLYCFCELIVLLFIQVKGVLKCEGSVSLCTPVTLVPVVKTTRFHLPHKIEGNSSVHTVSMMWACNTSGDQTHIIAPFTHL